MHRCIAFIDKKALLGNLSYLQSLSPGADTIVMVKANAYGHGLREITSILKEQPSLSLGVATIDEAIVARNISIGSQIFLFDGGASSSCPDALIDYDIIPVISSRHAAEQLAGRLKNRRIAIPKKVHLKIDTGFTRLGLDHREIIFGEHDEFLSYLANSPCFHLEGVATHFCSADVDDAFTDEQIANFKNCLSYLAKKGIGFSKIQLANSAAILRVKPHIAKDDRVLMIRPGLSAYGVSPLSDGVHEAFLKPVMSIKAQIVAIKAIRPGQGVGYGHSYVASSTRSIAIVSIGYGDGLRRSLSNHSYFLCGGQKAPIVGTISMDSCAIDVSDIPRASVGDMVTVLGRDGAENIDAKMLAGIDDTIPYEILTSIAERLVREIVWS